MRLRPSLNLLVLQLTVDWLSRFLVCAMDILCNVAIFLLELKFDWLTEFWIYTISIIGYITIFLLELNFWKELQVFQAIIYSY